MKLFKSREPNTFHYTTSVTHKRIPLFNLEKPCQIFADILNESRKIFPYKLVGYVIMPDHVHLIVNPIDSDVSKFLHKLNGNSARRIIDWLKDENDEKLLSELLLTNEQSKAHRYSVWQRNPSVIDLYSHKFLRQKMRYVHLNPIRAELCDHPAKWKWSSYHAYLPHQPGDVPVEIDPQPYWLEEEIKNHLKI